VPLAFLRALPPSAGLSLGEHLAQVLTHPSSGIDSLLACLPATHTPALHAPTLPSSSSPQTTQPPLTHAAINSFVARFALPHSPARAPLGPNDRIMLVLPTGPANALALLALAAYHTVAPVNASCTAAELLEDARRLRARAVVTTRDAVGRLELVHLQRELGVDVVFVDARGEGMAGVFDMGVMGAEGREVADAPSQLHGLHDMSLVLHTSGTSGKKKVVPYTLLALVVGTWSVVEGWALGVRDVNLNMMPLFHVGGIVRNLLAPVFSGGSAIVCAGFDARAFWSLARGVGATWYYAAPTIHHAILSSKPATMPAGDAGDEDDGEGEEFRPDRDLRIRMIANAAGGLLPSLAVELRDTFGAVVLPSYGMTECMPITTPPPTYALDRPGTSGLACGPHLSIRSPFNIELALGIGQEGAICVRGVPGFGGYEVEDEGGGSRLDTSCFSKEGWFDSGDMGHLDEDGYLFITGRSKEIINKGGEVVSPFEVEEAVSIAGKGVVKTTLAFGIEHDVLQETIGVVIVPVPGQPRIGLGQLQDLLREHLHPSKWPFAIVYMDELPKNSAGKPLRIKLATRLGIPCLSDSVPALHRHFEVAAADLPSPQAALTDPIPCRRVALDLPAVERALLGLHGVHDAAVRWPEAFVAAMAGMEASELRDALAEVLPGYAVPDPLHVLPGKLARSADGQIDFTAMEREVAERNAGAMGETAMLVRDVIAGLVGVDKGKISGESDFFLLGGNSLLLGKLAYQIRKETGVSIPVATLFTHTTVKGIAALIDADEKHSRVGSSSSSYPPSGHSRNTSEATLVYGGTHSGGGKRGQNHPISLMVQAVPFIFFYPLKAAMTWTILLLTLSELAPHVNGSYWERILSLLTAIIVARLATRIWSPLISIAFKWAVIGRYKPGKYRMWSGYYLRYWIVNQALRIAGRGIFSMHPSLEVFYYRLLGAKVGKGVKIDKQARLGEYDLLSFGDGCVVDNALIRGFCVEREGFFTLGRIAIGRDAVINTYTQISPGASIPPRAVYGPHASSHDAPSPEGFAACNRPMIPEPRLLFKVCVAWPVMFLVTFIAYIPWFTAVWLMINETDIIKENLNALESVVDWFATPERVMWHAVSRIVRAVITPLVQVALGLLVKRLFGFNTPTSVNAKPTEIALLRRYINAHTLSKSVLKSAFSILGTHYEVVSMIYRAMGAKIGRRVYWPGSGIFCLDPELLEIGDDVVFGSRSEVFTTDRLGTAKVTVGNGAMIADRVVLLPGAKIGKMTVMGSGALALRDTEYQDGSTWLGKGNRDTITPFGRAFYQRRAPFFVYPYALILLINILVAILSATYWSISAVAAAQVLRRIDLHESHRVTEIYRPSWFRPATIYGLIGLCFVVVLNIQAVLAIAWVVGTKWLIIGRRRDGQYAWDVSSYCQRWQLHLVLSRLLYKGYGNGGVLGPLTGSVYFVWYLKAMGARIGRNCALYPGGRAGLMTEPDLVQLGDNVSLDDCSVVAHINSRGMFALNSLEIGNGCAMRSGSRLLSGASMEDGSMLCEHTLLTSGDVADSGTVYSGWPAKPL
ncbi:acetyl-CoA synthetase-like protein, partial [Mycena vitilis]